VALALFLNQVKPEAVEQLLVVEGLRKAVLPRRILILLSSSGKRRWETSQTVLSLRSRRIRHPKSRFSFTRRFKNITRSKNRERKLSRSSSLNAVSSVSMGKKFPRPSPSSRIRYPKFLGKRFFCQMAKIII